MTNTAHLYRVIQDSVLGTPISGATVKLCNPGTTTPISAQIYTNESLTSQVANPFISPTGIVDVYLAAPQTVSLVVTYGVRTITIDYVDVLPNVENLWTTPAPLTISPVTPNFIPQASSDGSTLNWLDPSTLGGGGSAVGAILYNASQSSLTDAQRKQAQANTGVPHEVTPEQFGGGFDDSATDETSIIELCRLALRGYGGGVLKLDSTKTYVFTIQSPVGSNWDGITIQGGPDARMFAGRHGCIIQAPASLASGKWVIDIGGASSPVYCFNLIGVSVAVPPPSSGSSPLYGGVRVTNCQIGTFAGITIGNTSLGCLKVGGNSLGCTFSRLSLQNFWQFRAAAGAPVTGNEGALWVEGTDHTIDTSQCNGGVPIGSAVTDATNFWQCGILMNTLASTLINCNGEFADCGIKVTGYDNVFLGARADTNAGRGIQDDGYNNTWVGTKVFNNSLGGSGLYDGFVISSASFGGISIIGMLAHGFPSLAGQRGVKMRYVINDMCTPTTARTGYPWSPNSKSGVKILPGAYSIDAMLEAFPAGSLYGNAGGAPQYRPPSRHSLGMAWEDSVSGIRSSSNGVVWRDVVTGKTVGNLLPYGSNAPKAGTTTVRGSGFTPVTSTITVVDGFYDPETGTHQTFLRPAAVRVTANGAAARADWGMTANVGASAFPLKQASTGADVYTFILYARGITQTANLVITINWFAGTTLLSSTALPSQAIASGFTPTKYQQNATAPNTADHFSFTGTFSRAGMANGEAYEVVDMTMAQGITDAIEP